MIIDMVRGMNRERRKNMASSSARRMILYEKYDTYGCQSGLVTI